MRGGRPWPRDRMPRPTTAPAARGLDGFLLQPHVGAAVVEQLVKQHPFPHSRRLALTRHVEHHSAGSQRTYVHARRRCVIAPTMGVRLTRRS